MNSNPLKALLFGALTILFVLHNDLWLWNDSRLFLGLPVGLTYHVLYCFAASVLFYLLVKLIWPKHLEPENEEASPSSPLL